MSSNNNISNSNSNISNSNISNSNISNSNIDDKSNDKILFLRIILFIVNLININIGFYILINITNIKFNIILFTIIFCLLNSLIIVLCINNNYIIGNIFRIIFMIIVLSYIIITYKHNTNNYHHKNTNLLNYYIFQIPFLICNIIINFILILY
jgi:hypothetical protein